MLLVRSDRDRHWKVRGRGNGDVSRRQEPLSDWRRVWTFRIVVRSHGDRIGIRRSRQANTPFCEQEEMTGRAASGRRCDGLGLRQAGCGV